MRSSTIWLQSDHPNTFNARCKRGCSFFCAFIQSRQAADSVSSTAVISGLTSPYIKAVPQREVWKCSVWAKESSGIRLGCNICWAGYGVPLINILSGSFVACRSPSISLGFHHLSAVVYQIKPWISSKILLKNKKRVNRHNPKSSHVFPLMHSMAWQSN